MATTLAISHNIFLNDKEREQLLQPAGSIIVVGISVPVWFTKGITSEPAIEVYSNYLLNNKQDIIYIKHNEEGYEITAPPTATMANKLPDGVWDSLPKEEQDKWWAVNEPGPCLENLKDIKQGGCRWMAFRQYNKVKRNKKTLNVVHYVEIKMIDDLINTLS